jgi:hypothetical protein
MESILEKNGHIKRYATQEEMSKCIECLADELWQDVIREDARFVDKISLEKGEIEFKKEVRLEYEDILGCFGIVDYFPEENCSVITTSYTYKDSKEGCVMSTPYRFINMEGIYSCVEEDTEFLNFKLSIFIKKAIDSLKNTAGRPNRPTDNSIEKSLFILDAMRTEEIGIDFACEQIGLPKSTYYKTLKWLQKNAVLGIS